MQIKWQAVSFEQLSTAALFEIMRARVDVFVVEQACAYPELDDADIAPTTVHLCGYIDDKLVAYARCLQGSEHSAIGRVLCTKQWRGQGIAKALVERAINQCRLQMPKQVIKISAQTYLLSFYESFGFVTQGDVYLEDGIEHQDMLLVDHGDLLT